MPVVFLRGSQLFILVLAVLAPVHRALDKSCSNEEKSCTAVHLSGTNSPEFCFVVRTYWGHGDSQGGDLRRLLYSLRNQTNPNWEAIMVVADSTPFDDLHSILQSLNDSRAWVYAEWIGEEYTPKEDGVWIPSYHGILYNLTDDAIRVCNPSSKWVIITNGDNLYGKSFLAEIAAESAAHGADIIAFDFYSRYTRPTMPPCERFMNDERYKSNCKKNHLEWCHVDLGSVALNRPKFMEEERGFGSVNSTFYGLNEEHNDGLLIGELVEQGWHVSKIENACPFVHSPSIQSCSWSGGIWDDRDIKLGGGSCITPEEAQEILESDPNTEEVEIRVMHAENYVDEFIGALPLLNKTRCIRYKDYMSERVWGRTLLWFGDLCTDALDFQRYEEARFTFYKTEDDEEKALDAVRKEHNVSTS